MTDTPPGGTHHPANAVQPEDLPPDPLRPATKKTPGGPGLATMIVIGIVALAAVAAVLFAWKLPPFNTGQERTENATVRGQVTIVSPQVGGYVDEVLVRDFQTVAAGQPLFRIDDRIYRQRLEQAQATLAARRADLSNSAQTRASREATLGAREAEIASARAQLTRASADLARVADLAADGSVSLRERDQAQAALRSAEAAVRQTEAGRDVARQDIRSVGVSREGLMAAVAGAEAAVHLAEIDLDNTVIKAPESGRLGQVGARRGQSVTAGSQLVALVPPRLWIIANFKERQTGRMTPGQRATVTIDALGDRRYTGRIRQISPATGSEFTVLPAQNATGNFTKVAQRLPVEIHLDPDQTGLDRLRPGMSVVAFVDTGSSPEARP